MTHTKNFINGRSVKNASKLATWLLCCATCLCFLVSSISIAAPPEKTAEEELLAEIPKLIKQLGSEEWKVREAATKKLKDIGMPARGAVAAAFCEGSIEVTARARLILLNLLPAVADFDEKKIVKKLREIPQPLRDEVLTQMATYKSEKGPVAFAKLPPPVREEITMLYLRAELKVAEATQTPQDNRMPLAGTTLKGKEIFGVAEFLCNCGWTQWGLNELEKIVEEPADPAKAGHAFLGVMYAAGRANAALKLCALREGRKEYGKSADALQIALNLVDQHKMTLDSGKVEGLKAKVIALRVQHFRAIKDGEKLKEALVQLEQYPNEAAAVVQLYEVMKEQGLEKEAVQKVETARASMLKELADSPDGDELRNQLAYMLAKTNQHLEEAQQLAEKNLEQKSDDVDYVSTLAEVLFHRDQKQRAIETIQRALELRPNHPFLLEQLNRYRNEH